MPARAFLDSNVLIYAVGDDDSRRKIADSLLALGPVISIQVLAETAAVLRRKFQAPPATVEQILQAILPRVQCEPLTAAMVVSALHIGERLGYAHYDSQIICRGVGNELRGAVFGGPAARPGDRRQAGDRQPVRGLKTVRCEPD